MNPIASERRVAIVTGGARGLGAHVALALARRNIVPVLAVRDTNAAKPVKDAVEALGLPCEVLRCDVVQPDEVIAFVDQVVGKWGRLDALINNAGVIAPIGHLAQTAPDEWAHSITANLVGPYRLLQAALPALLQSRAVVVNVLSGAAHTPLEGWSAYCSAKAGLAMLTRCVALEYGPRGIVAYGFHPGLLDTGMQEQIRASGVNDISRLPRENLPSPVRAAEVLAWLVANRPEDFAGQEVGMNTPELVARVDGAQ